MVGNAIHMVQGVARGVGRFCHALRVDALWTEDLLRVVLPAAVKYRHAGLDNLDQSHSRPSPMQVSSLSLSGNNCQVQRGAVQRGAVQLCDEVSSVRPPPLTLDKYRTPLRAQHVHVQYLLVHGTERSQKHKACRHASSPRRHRLMTATRRRVTREARVLGKGEGGGGENYVAPLRGDPGPKEKGKREEREE